MEKGAAKQIHRSFWTDVVFAPFLVDCSLFPMRSNARAGAIRASRTHSCALLYVARGWLFRLGLAWLCSLCHSEREGWDQTALQVGAGLPVVFDVELLSAYDDLLDRGDYDDLDSNAISEYWKTTSGEV